MARILNPLEESLKRIGRARNDSGKRMTGEEALRDGADIFRNLVNGENPIVFPRQKMIDTLIYFKAVRTSREARKVLDGLTRQEIHYDDGHLYFEMVEKNRIAIGYSLYG